jgi:hypothetical protein
MASWEEPHPRFGRGVTWTPRFGAVLARAEGLALARGEKPDDDDVLVSLLWEPDCLAASLLRAHGGRAAVAKAFVERGGVLPGELPPERERPPMGERVWVPRERLMEIVHAVQQETSRLGFNTTADGRAWLHAEERVDVQAIADRVLADA